MRCARLIKFLLVGAVAGIAPQGAQAQATFTRPIRILVPVAPGGTTDLTARLVANGIGESLAPCP